LRNGLVATALVVLLGFGALWYRASSTVGENPTSASNQRTRAAAAVSVVTAPVEKGDFAVRRRSIGTIESPATVLVRARLDSQVAEQHVVDGQIVSNGDLLTLAKDKAVLDRTTADLARTEALLAKNVAPRQQLDQITADRKSAEATVAGDDANLRADRVKLSYTKITAPIDGRTGTVRVTPGNLVSAGDPNGLVTITQVKPLRLSFTLPERDVTALRAALERKPPASVRVFAPGANEPLASGQLNFVDSTVDTPSGTILARAIFANEDLTLWPGQYLDVEIDLDVIPNTALVPTVALQTGQQGPFVFVTKPDHTVEMRNVTMAGSDGDKTAVLTGVNPGERVVVEGQLRLANGARVQEAAGRAETTGQATAASERAAGDAHAAAQE
jgi:multidrug efflux system membrane fusion protein